MAAQTKSVSGAATTYVITDMENNTVTVVATQNPTTGLTVTYSSSGGLHADGMALLSTLNLLLQTGIAP